jgi:hypothetical protein
MRACVRLCTSWRGSFHAPLPLGAVPVLSPVCASLSGGRLLLCPGPYIYLPGFLVSRCKAVYAARAMLRSYPAALPWGNFSVWRSEIHIHPRIYHLFMSPHATAPHARAGRERWQDAAERSGQTRRRLLRELAGSQGHRDMARAPDSLSSLLPARCSCTSSASMHACARNCSHVRTACKLRCRG